jgi:PleD family two-component response regulator
MAPPKEDPRLSDAPQEKPAKPGNGLAAQFNKPDIDKWKRRRVLLCIEDMNIRERLRNGLDGSRYEVFSADLAAEAVELANESRAEIVVLSPGFDPEHQGGAGLMMHVNRLTPQTRRRTYVVLVSSQLRTLDTYLAFANGVNLTIHPEDVDSFQAIFERSVRDYNELYRPFHQASAIEPF